MDVIKRRKNERKFENWDELPDGGRRYWYNVLGRLGWTARYVKEVDANEGTVSFYQEILNEKGQLMGLHEKFPKNKGHKKFEEV